MQCRVGNLEFRHLETDKAEIVAWSSYPDGAEHCYTILYWKRDSEGYSVQFVGPRPFEYENTESLWAMMRYGQKILDALHDFQEFHKQ